MADIKYLITVDATVATKEIKQFDGTLDGLAKTSGTAEKAHKSLFGQFALGDIVASAAKKTLSLLWNELKAFPGAAIEAEKADRALSSALEITGRPVASLTKHFGDYAAQLQKVTIYDDEQIKKSQALLVQLTNLDKDGLDRATKGSIGLASVLGMDLESAASLVAKAMSGNVSVLSRYGIQVDQTKSKEDQRAQVLDKLEQFYGRATAESETYGGKLVMLKNKYGEIQEAVGKYITKNTGLITSLNKLADAAMFFLTKEENESRILAVLNQQNKERADLMVRAAKLSWDSAEDISNLTKLTNLDVIATQKMIREGKFGNEIKENFIKLSRASYDAQAKETAALKAAEKGTNKHTDEVKDATKAVKKYADVVYDMPGAIKKVTNAQYEQVPGLEAVDGKIIKMTLDLGGWQRALKNADTAGLQWSQGTLETFNQALAAAQQFASAAGSLFQALTDRKLSLLDKEYQAQVYKIEQSTMSEEEKYIALSQLEEEHEAKSEAIRIAGAKKQKRISYLTAVMDAAGAIVNALNTHPFIPAGLIAAASAAIMGGLQVATIASTPLAKGGIFSRPTLLAGGQYEVAEAGEKEVVAPLSGLRRELGIGKGGGNGGGPMVIHNYIVLDGKVLKEFITKTIQDSANIGKVRLPGKAVA